MKRILFFCLLVLLLFPKSVLAVGDLDVTYLGFPISGPIFNVTNMLPGDSDSKDLVVTNTRTVDHQVKVKGVRTGGVGTDPKLETVLEIVISANGSDIYGGTQGTKTVAQFFTDSATGLPLGIVSGGDSRTFTFAVFFPHTAGNEFQNKSVIFDLIFESPSTDHIVINEVFYRVDDAHGLDSPKDRGIVDVDGNSVTLVIKDNGTGSVNEITYSRSDACKIIQSSSTNVDGYFVINGNTGGNGASANTGANTSIFTGWVNNIFNFFVSGGTNILSGTCGQKLGQNHEWIELYNPTAETVNLKNWTITDNSGISVKISGNKNLLPGAFALISKDNATWNFWSEPAGVLKIALGKQIGDGLDNDGDRLLLKNPNGTLIDALSYGTDISVFTLGGITLGHSLERVPDGNDADLSADWFDTNPPTPGT